MVLLPSHAPEFLSPQSIITGEGPSTAFTMHGDAHIRQIAGVAGQLRQYNLMQSLTLGAHARGLRWLCVCVCASAFLFCLLALLDASADTARKMQQK